MLMNRVLRSSKKYFFSNFNPVRYSFSQIPPKTLQNPTKKFVDRFQDSKYMDTQDNLRSLSNYSQEFMGNESPFDSNDKNSYIVNNEKLEIINEGKAQILHLNPKSGDTEATAEETAAFYNPVQTMNRDITLLVLQEYVENLRREQKEKFHGLKILDAFSGTGIRTIRMMKELDPSDVMYVHACDSSENSVNVIKKNIQLNQLDTSKVHVFHNQVQALMFEKSSTKNNFADVTKRYDVIDLDPFGSSIPYMTPAMQAIEDGGLICATFTDMKVLCHDSVEKCFYLYGSSKVKMASCHENAVRIALHAINNCANKLGKYIEPILCYSSDHYQRLFFTVRYSRKDCWKSFVKYSNVYACPRCGNFHLHQLGKAKERSLVPNPINFDIGKCNQCDGPLSINGPIWTDNINDIHFIQKLSDKIEEKKLGLELSTEKKIAHLLDGILKEGVTADHPLAISIDQLASIFKIVPPSKKVLSDILTDHGYSISNSYLHSKLIKTDAPLDFIYDLLRQIKKEECHRSEQPLMKGLGPGITGYDILSKPPKHDISTNKL